MSIDHDCSCGECTAADLPVSPFEALRARQGMLLGEDDFRVLAGNPRGKHMVHAAWLHGTGVVWGFDVQLDGLVCLDVRPGLAVDRMGRELALTATEPVDLRDWLAEKDHPASRYGDTTRTVTACLVAEFGCSTGKPVPTLADPCDVSRTHDTASRILEEVRINLVPGRCPPCSTHHYPRLRALFGLDEGSRTVPAGKGVAAFCHHMQCLAAEDAAEREQPCQEGTDVPTPFPVAEQDAGVVLSCVEIDVRDADGCTTIEKVRLDDCCRCVLLPTQVISELLCALAARVVGPHHGYEPDDHDEPVEGPRVHADDVWWDDGEQCYRLPVSGELAAGSVRRAVTVTSLSTRGWVEEQVESVRYDAGEGHIVVKMDARPENDVVRLVVKGTGPTPIYGVDPPAPLAGVKGGPPAGRHDGYDAVVTVTAGQREREGS